MKNNHRFSRARSAARTSITPTLTKRVLFYGALILILCTAQCSFFSYLKPFGATPDLLLGMLVAIMLLDSAPSACVCAVISGYVIDSIGAIPPSFSPLYYLALVAALSMISAKMLPRFISYCVMLPAALVGRAIFTFINLCISYASVPSVKAIVSVILPEAISTFVFCLPIYLAVRLGANMIGARRKFEFN